jgi:predicted CXXCH cytochrome family protein
VASLAANGPLGANETIAWSHAPFEMGECSLCHESNDPNAPGGLVSEVNELCFSCHDMFQEMLAGFENIHSPVGESRTACHNPHNSSREKLLNLDTTTAGLIPVPSS